MSELRERRGQGIAGTAIDQGQQSGIAEPSIDQGQQSSNSGFYQALLHGGDYLHASDTQASAGLYDNPLPCCGCGIGWFLYVLFISLSSPSPLFLLASTIILSFPFFHYWACFLNHPLFSAIFPFHYWRLDLSTIGWFLHLGPKILSTNLQHSVVDSHNQDLFLHKSFHLPIGLVDGT